jgi:tetratricopeptide (TPR) repeat protein
MNKANHKAPDVDLISKDMADAKSQLDGKGGIDRSPNTMNNTNGSVDPDSMFQKHYSKELKVNEDEIPFVLAEFIENALRYIKKEQFEKALILLQKAHGIINVISIDNWPRDKYFGYVIFVNMAVWFQKLGSLEEWSIALENALIYLDTYTSLNDQSIAKRMKIMQQEARIRIQLCALFSQLHQHKDALEQARMSTRLIHGLIKDLLALCEFYTKKKHVKEKVIVYDESILPKNNRKINQMRSYMYHNDSHSRFINDNIFENEIEEKPSSVSPLRRAAMYNYLEDDLSLIERTAQRVKPIIESLVSHLVKEKKIDDIESIDRESLSEDEKSHVSVENVNEPSAVKNNKKVNKKIEPDMRIVLGYLNQLEMIANLNIGNIMQIVPIKIEDLLSVPRNETEFNRASFIDKISLLWVAYFCISTEIRFIIQLKEDETFDEKTKNEESEYWHAKSLEISWTFLPSDWPLLNHILLSYQKHHSPCQQTIQEDQENEQNLHIVKPLKGIENSKFKPIIRRIDAEHIALTPPDFSPADTITNQMILSYQSFINYGSNSMYQANKSNILDYSSNKDKSRNTGTTRHRSTSPNVVGGETESFRSANSKSVHPDKTADSGLQQNSVNSGFSMKGSSEQQNARHTSQEMYERKPSVALVPDDFEFEEHPKPKTGKKSYKDKDSLLVDSMMDNHHSTSYKEIRQEDSLNGGMLSNDVSKVNMTEDMGLQSFGLNEKKKQAKDKKFLSKLIDRRSSSSQKRMRPKSSKGIRSNHVKVNTMNNADQNVRTTKNKKASNYLNSAHGNRLRNKQSNRKKNPILGVRPSSGKDLRHPNLVTR